MEKLRKTYRNIYKIPRQYIPIMILTFFSINILGLALPLTMKKIYGSVVISRSVETLQFVLAIALLALILEAIMRRLKDTSSKWIAHKFEFQMSSYLIDKMFKTHDTQDTNYISVLEKFKSISRLSSFYSTAFYQLLIDVPFLFLYLFLIYLYGSWLVLIPFVLSVLYIITVMILSNRYFSRQKTYIDHNDKLIGMLIESLEKIHFVKSSGTEEAQYIKYKKLLDEMTFSEFESNKQKVLPYVLGSKVSQLSLFMMLITGGYMMSNDAITFGQITACAMLGSRAISPVLSMMRYYQQTRDIRLIKEQLNNMAAIPEIYSDEIPSFPNDIYGQIEVLNLSYNDIQTNNEMKLTTSIAAGDFVVINPMEFPSYKNVLKKMIGQEQVYDGRVLIDNLDISKWNMHKLKGKIEYLEEHVAIFKGSVIENITHFDNGEQQNAFEAAKLTGLDTLVSQMPSGFETELESQMLNYLSSAFLQRLNLTRALLERPRILVMDRIDGSMDQETLDIFIWILEKLKGQTTIVIATWHEDIINMSDYYLKAETVKGSENG